jgi:phosphoglycolate phosphatase
MLALLFDLDGTLIDSLEDLADAVNAMLIEHGHPTRPLSLFPQYIGEGVRILVERALPEGSRGDAEIDACMADYQKHYESRWHNKTKPYAGMVETLAGLKSRGAKVAVLSNKPDHFTQLCCAHFFAPGTFDYVLGARAHVPRKPHPAGALEIAKHLGLEAGDCAYVGDSGLDMDMARAADMLAIGVKWGFRSEKELLAHGAQHLVGRPEELLQFVSNEVGTV